MSVKHHGPEPLPLAIFNTYDNKEDRAYKKIFAGLGDGAVTPYRAARDFDAMITEQSERRLQSFLMRPDPNLTYEEIREGITLREIMPNASGDIEEGIQTLMKLSSSFPPHHVGQDRIIQFLEALKAIPRHIVHDQVPSPDGSHPGFTIILWNLGGNWMDLPQFIYQEAKEYSHPYSDIETLGSEARIRWCNFQSAIARITARGLIDCGFMCALGSIIPSSHSYPDFEKRKVGGPNRVGADVIAGTQWLLWPEEREYVWKQCKKAQRLQDKNGMWSMERWSIWKDQFDMVISDSRFDSEARVAATWALRHMLETEKGEVEGKVK